MQNTRPGLMAPRWPGRMIAGLGLLALATLSACDGSDRKPATARLPVLPHAVLAADWPDKRLHLHVASLVEGGVFTSSFGARRTPMGGANAHHDGLDIAAPAGTPVRASAGGAVVEIGWHGAYGRLIRLRHSDRIETAYAHLAGFATGLTVGARVRQDDVIGHVGTSGRSSGSHLHYEVRRDGRAIDPLALPVLGRGG